MRSFCPKIIALAPHFCIDAEELEKMLHHEAQKASSLEVNLKRVEGDLVESSACVGHLLEQEKVLQDRCREQVRAHKPTDGCVRGLIVV